MKKILLMGLLLGLSAFAAEIRYEVLLNETGTIDPAKVVKVETIYEGDYGVYQDNYAAIAGKMAEGTLLGLQSGAGALAQGMSSGLTNGAAGAGVGIVIGAIQYQIDKSNSAQRYIIVEKYIMEDGKYETRNYFFVGSKNPAYEEDQIKEFIKDAKNSYANGATK